MSVVLRFFDYGSPDYQQELVLRQKILRTPLGLTLDPEKLKLENTDFHLGAFTDEQMIGCLILSPQDSSVIKMRQVAVDDSVQGLGIGKLLVLGSEKFAAQRGFQEMKLSARETAIPFYERLGYEIYGEPFSEVGIPHRFMKKSLA